MQRLLTTLVAFFALLLCTGHSVASAATNAAKPAPARAAVSDAQIDATIRMKLAKSKIGKDGFKYRVQHGVVTWDGKTDVIQHKGSATRMAHAAGASQVVNNIQISANAKAKAAANLKKAYIK